MKPIVKRILETGLVSKHTAALMERWGTLDRGSSDLIDEDSLRSLSKETLVAFAEDIDQMLAEHKDVVTEVKLAVQIGDPFLIRFPVGEPTESIVVAFRDEMGNILLPPNQSVWPGEKLQIVADGTYYSVLDTTTLYVAGSLPYATQLTTEPVPETGNER